MEIFILIIGTFILSFFPMLSTFLSYLLVAKDYMPSGSFLYGSSLGLVFVYWIIDLILWFFIDDIASRIIIGFSILTLIASFVYSGYLEYGIDSKNANLLRGLGVFLISQLIIFSVIGSTWQMFQMENIKYNLENNENKKAP